MNRETNEGLLPLNENLMNELLAERNKNVRNAANLFTQTLLSAYANANPNPLAPLMPSDALCIAQNAVVMAESLEQVLDLMDDEQPEPADEELAEDGEVEDADDDDDDEDGEDEVTEAGEAEANSAPRTRRKRELATA